MGMADELSTPLPATSSGEGDQHAADQAQTRSEKIKPARDFRGIANGFRDCPRRKSDSGKNRVRKDWSRRGGQNHNPSAPYKLAPIRLAPRNSVPNKFAFCRFERTRLAPRKFAMDKSAPAKFMRWR